MTRMLIYAVMAALISACSAPDTRIPPADQASLDAFGAMDSLHRLDLAAPSEPGIRLTVMGRLVRLEDGSPIGGTTISIYQANSEGNYEERVPGDEATARLNGTVVTDSDGLFLIRSVLPGDYGNTENNRHIHMSIPGADPEAYDFYFLQRINRGLLSWARDHDQAIILSLQSLPDGTLIAKSDVPIKNFD